MKVKKGDFVEIEYTGKLADKDVVFDTTDAELAKKNGMFNPRQKYGPVVVCVGQGQVVRGVDKELPGKQTDKEYEMDVKPEDGFGKRSAKLIQLVSAKKFKEEQRKKLYPGAKLFVDNKPATVKSVSGGRILLDFNHPLASKKLHYEVKINKKVTDAQRQAESLIEKLIPSEDFKTELKNKALEIKVKNKEQYEIAFDKIKSDIKELVKDVDKANITEDKTPASEGVEDNKKSEKKADDSKKKANNSKSEGSNAAKKNKSSEGAKSKSETSKKEN